MSLLDHNFGVEGGNGEEETVAPRAVVEDVVDEDVAPSPPSSSKDFVYEDKRWPTKRAVMRFSSRVDDRSNGSGKVTYILQTEGFGHPFSENDGPDEGYNCEFFVEGCGPSEEACRNRMYPILKELVERTLADPELPTFARKYGRIAGGLLVEVSQIGVKYEDDVRSHGDRKVGLFVGMPHTRGSSYTNSAGKVIPIMSVKLLKRCDLLLLRMGGEERIRKTRAKFKNDGTLWISKFDH